MARRPAKEFLSSSFNRENYDNSYQYSKRLSETQNISKFSKISYYNGKHKTTMIPSAKIKSRDTNKLDVNSRRAVTQKEKQISFDIKDKLPSSHGVNFNKSDLLRPSTGETHSVWTSNSVLKSENSQKLRSGIAFDDGKTEEEADQIQRMSEELTLEELYKLHKMLKQAQNKQIPENNPKLIYNFSSMIIDSIGGSAIKIIYQRMWDNHKLIRKLAASILSKLCNHNLDNQIKIWEILKFTPINGKICFNSMPLEIAKKINKDPNLFKEFKILTWKKSNNNSKTNNANKLNYLELKEGEISNNIWTFPEFKGTINRKANLKTVDIDFPDPKFYMIGFTLSADQPQSNLDRSNWTLEQDDVSLATFQLDQSPYNSESFHDVPTTKLKTDSKRPKAITQKTAIMKYKLRKDTKK